MATEQTAANDQPATGIAEFARQTRREIAKVTWPTRREVTTTTMLIVVFAVVAGLFFLLVDWGLGSAVEYILGMKS